MLDKPDKIDKDEKPSLRLHHRAEEAAAELPALRAAADKAAKSILTGEHAQRKSGTGERFWQYREYTPGDRIQDIDWRASARGQRLYIRQKEWQTTQTALFWVQNNEAMTYASRNDLPDKAEESATLALALAILMTGAGEQVGLLSGAMRPGRTETALQTLGEHMIVPDNEELPVLKTQQIKPDSNIVLIGDFLSPIEDIEKQISSIMATTENGMIIQVLDPAEHTLPFTGRIVFESGGREKHHISNVESIRDDYKERIDEHLTAVKKLCKQHQWHWILHTTDRPVRETLFEAWMMITHEYIGGTVNTNGLNEGGAL